MYVLLFVDNSNQPRYIQGSMDEINKRLAELWEAHEIDRDDWEYYSNFQLLAIEDGALTTVNWWEVTNIPQFVVA